MAYINLLRGGTPVFKPMFCAGEYAEYVTPFDAPHQPGTPPFDSHADAAHGQGYLNLHYPLVPHILDTRAHAWMQTALKKVKAANDVILTNWVPLRSYLDSYYIELTKPDEDLTGVYVEPVAYRVEPDPDDPENLAAATFTQITEFGDELENACGAKKIPLGTPAAEEKRYLFARLNTLASESSSTSSSTSTLSGTDVTTETTTTTETETSTGLPWSFGHNLVDGDGEGIDDYYGAVVLGLKVTGSDADLIKRIYDGHFEVHLSAKVITFEGSTQIA